MNWFVDPIYLSTVKMGVVAIPIFLVGLVGWVYIVGLGGFFWTERRNFSLRGVEFRKSFSQGKLPKNMEKTIANTYAKILFYNRNKDIYLLRYRANTFYNLVHLVISQKLQSIKVMAAVAPILGLLGTVNGIIHTFEIITREGTTNAILLSDGISEALLTTQAGLVVSVPFIFMYTTLNNSFKKVLAQMDAYEMSFSELREDFVD